MGILNRFKTIMESNINALLDKCEDPEKMIDQTLRDARENLAEVKDETAGVMADAENSRREYEKAQAEIEKYTNAAMNALKSGNETDARKLLERKATLEANLPTLKSTMELHAQNAERLRTMYNKLKSDIETLEAKRGSIKAANAAAKAQEHINDIVDGGEKARSSMETFDRMADKANRRLDAAMAEAKLNEDSDSTGDLLGKYASGSSQSVDDELAAMKAKLGL